MLVNVRIDLQVGFSGDPIPPTSGWAIVAHQPESPTQSHTIKLLHEGFDDLADITEELKKAKMVSVVHNSFALQHKRAKRSIVRARLACQGCHKKKLKYRRAMINQHITQKSNEKQR